jgi:hypothetical protein
MAAVFTWGHWEEQWPGGQFRCVFVESNHTSDGMIHASGLFRAVPGESLDDLDSYQDRITDRMLVATDGNGGLVVRKEFAELVATLPVFMQEASKRIRRLDSPRGYRRASCRSHSVP